jgi:hypothetical protein
MWLGVTIAVISALGAILGAIISGRYANMSKTAELGAARVLELEKRLASSREDIYRPMVELLREMFDSARSKKQVGGPKDIQTLSRFTSWIQIYGSDEVLLAYHKLMQAAFKSAPPIILMRYVAELTLELRRDLGAPQTELRLTDLMGLRLNDIYDAQWRKAFDTPEKELLDQENWRPPWGNRFDDQQ